ncbi:WYL domain-containing protein [Rhodobacteraceae bacterium RKSG542]|uniref:WYL domain-containing protein n=1 Tax=Pseudovibrio flavus TaxID=2529854 RepID=UPI0012BC296B|nr:WYL domain-containing protein [Pseudovibrio flavus]MTI15947.1 WYL domain-containing protein [Pseudovibrio flavus]
MTDIYLKNFGRFGWIEASLRYSGTFSSAEKKGYMAFFGLSKASVSYDQDKFIALFNRVAAHECIRNLNGKIVVRTELPLQSVFNLPTVSQWLEQAYPFNFYRAPTIDRAQPDPNVLQTILSSMRSQQPCSILYDSKRTAHQYRMISPHHIVDIHDRLHVRAHDHSTNIPSDFVLSRIVSAEFPATRPNQWAPITLDRPWNQMTKLHLSIAEHIPAAGCVAVQRDFALDDTGHRTLSVRHAVARYYLEPQNDEEKRAFASPIKVSDKSPNTRSD